MSSSRKRPCSARLNARAAKRGRSGPSWEEQQKATLENAALKRGLKLFWFATGKDDFLVENTRKTVAFFKGRGFAPVYDETDGAHTWTNWRRYLKEFAQRLFQ